MLRRFQKFFKKTAESSGETFAYYVGNGLVKPRHLAKGYDLFFFNSWDLIYLNYIAYL